jgi:hypothetical protein
MAQVSQMTEAKCLAVTIARILPEQKGSQQRPMDLPV